MWFCTQKCTHMYAISICKASLGMSFFTFFLIKQSDLNEWKIKRRKNVSFVTQSNTKKNVQEQVRCFESISNAISSFSSTCAIPSFKYWIDPLRAVPLQVQRLDELELIMLVVRWALYPAQNKCSNTQHHDTVTTKHTWKLQHNFWTAQRAWRWQRR